MRFSLFVKKVQTALGAFWGDEMSLQIHKVTKNNGIELTGLIIRREDQDVATTIYLEPFFEEYENGMTMSETVNKIIRVYEENRIHLDTDMTFFDHYDQVKARLACRLISREKNSRLLERVPHRQTADLAVVCHCVLIGDEFGCASVVIEYSHLKYWQISEDQLFADMLENIPLILPPRRVSMRQFVRESIRRMVSDNMQELRRLEEDEMEDGEWDLILDNITEMLMGEHCREQNRMQILTNCNKFFGAAVILYPGLLEQLTRSFAEQFFILPCSVHEVILLEDTGWEDPEELRQLVQCVNRTNVAADEFLSDEVYYYAKGMENIQLLEP